MVGNLYCVQDVGMTDQDVCSGTQFPAWASLFPVLFRTLQTIRVSRSFGMHLHLMNIVSSSDRIIGEVAKMFRKSGLLDIILVMSFFRSRGRDISEFMTIS